MKLHPIDQAKIAEIKARLERQKRAHGNLSGVYPSSEDVAWLLEQLEKTLGGLAQA